MLQYIDTFAAGTAQQRLLSQQLAQSYQQLVFGNATELAPVVKRQVRQLKKELKQR